MKNAMATLLAVLSITLSAHAKESKSSKASKTTTVDVAIEQRIDGSVIIGFQKFNDSVVNIRVSNSQGDLVFKEKVADKDVFLKKLDVSSLPAGRYGYEVSTRDYKVVKYLIKE